MINQPSPLLPLIKELPYYVMAAGLSGYLYGKVASVNPTLTATILVVHAAAHTLFFYSAHHFFKCKNTDSQKTKNLNDQKIIVVTSTLINMVTLVTLKEFNLVGQLVYFLMGAGALGHLIKRASYIQAQEKALFNSPKVS